MATVAPEAALEAAALATLKRTGISSSNSNSSGNSGNQSNEPANVLSKLSASLQQQQQQHQPLKKRRLANALLTPTTSLKSASTHSSLSSSSSTSQRDHNQYHYAAAAAAAAAIAHSHLNGDISTGFNGSDDLTNLNWLQDANLLKSIYSSESSSDASSSAQAAATGDFVIAQRRPPLNNQQNHPHHQQHPPLHRKPPYSYSALIFLAIESSPNKSMMVRDIYAWIVQNFPFFATAPAGWKNTIRHTLSLRKCFKKVDRCTGAEIAAGDSDSDSGDNKGGLWHVDDEYRATLQQLVARAQQNVLPKLVVMNGSRRISAAERVLLPKKKVTHWGGTARNGGKGRWPLKTTPLGDVHYQQNGKQHNGAAAAAAAVMPVMPGQKFIQVPVIRSFFPYRYHPHPHPHPHPHHHHHRVNRCQPPAAMTQADVRTSAEAQECEAASYKLQLMTLNKLNSSSSSSSHGGHTHRSTAHIPRRPPAISAAAARNSVSVISVNQAPKVYAPVPKVTMASCGGSVEKPIAASDHNQHHHYHNYHYLHQPPAPSQPSSPVACLQPLSNAKDALTAAPHLQKFLPSSKKPAAAAEKHKAQSSAVMTAAASVAGISSSPHIVCPPSYNHHHHHHCHYQPPPPPQSTGSSVFVKKFLLSPSDDDEEEEDMLIRDGAEALLNFASSAFSLNRLIKQED